jgi:hypothetical protein
VQIIGQSDDKFPLQKKQMSLEYASVARSCPSLSCSHTALLSCTSAPSPTFACAHAPTPPSISFAGLPQFHPLTSVIQLHSQRSGPLCPRLPPLQLLHGTARTSAPLAAFHAPHSPFPRCLFVTLWRSGSNCQRLRRRRGNLRRRRATHSPPFTYGCITSRRLTTPSFLRYPHALVSVCTVARGSRSMRHRSRLQLRANFSRRKQQHSTAPGRVLDAGTRGNARSLGRKYRLSLSHTPLSFHPGRTRLHGRHDGHRRILNFLLRSRRCPGV